VDSYASQLSGTDAQTIMASTSESSNGQSVTSTAGQITYWFSWSICEVVSLGSQISGWSRTATGRVFILSQFCTFVNMQPPLFDFDRKRFLIVKFTWQRKVRGKIGMMEIKGQPKCHLLPFVSFPIQ
jgi:hypothetical protein